MLHQTVMEYNSLIESISIHPIPCMGYIINQRLEGTDINHTTITVSNRFMKYGVESVHGYDNRNDSSHVDHHRSTLTHSIAPNIDGDEYFSSSSFHHLYGVCVRSIT
jgi:hypothetical protein